MPDTIDFQGQYRVLVVNSEEDVESDSQVLAICLEQNLVGRGRNKEAALSDFAGVITYAIVHELLENIPAYPHDPDPGLVTVFEDKSASETADGDLILHRLKCTFAIELKKTFEESADPFEERSRRVTYEEYAGMV